MTRSLHLLQTCYVDLPKHHLQVEKLTTTGMRISWDGTFCTADLPYSLNFDIVIFFSGMDGNFFFLVLLVLLPWLWWRCSVWPILLSTVSYVVSVNMHFNFSGKIWQSMIWRIEQFVSLTFTWSYHCWNSLNLVA